MPRLSYRSYRSRPFWLLPLCVAVAVFLMPLYIAQAGVLRTATSVVLMAMLVVGVNITFGYAGDLTNGQAAVYALGAYVGGYLAVQGFDVIIVLLASTAAAAVLGLLTGIPGVRLGSWSLAMVTFFLVLLVPDVVILLTPVTGGTAGLNGIPAPTLFGRELGSTGYFMLVIAVAALFFTLLRNYVTSRHGSALKVVRESPVLARSLGYSVTRIKLIAYLISALPAGAAGALFAYQDGYISPISFSFAVAVTILAGSIIGGANSIYGAAFGAAVLVVGPLQLSNFAEYSLILFGLLLVLGGLFFTAGIAGLLRRLIRDSLVGDDLMPDVRAVMDRPEEVTDLPGETLHVAGIKKSFGGNAALRGVNLTARKGEITALIGPNGSGKTTLLNIISGFYQPDEGAIEVGDRGLIGLKAYRVAAAGVSRTFQTPLVPQGMTVAEVVASARYRRSPSYALGAMLHLPGSRRAEQRDRHEALQLLSLMGIVELADHSASELPLGTRRILEVARALAGEPAVVLLDEPASGLDESEVSVLSDVLLRLRGHGATIIIVEHNFEMIMTVSDEVNVLHLGQIIACGTPNHVRSNPEVVESYLGKAARAELERQLAGNNG